MAKSNTQGLNPQFDAYIAKAQPFAQPILEHIRQIVHKGCKNVVETIKWGFPNFDYNGRILCSMAAFKQHCSFGFWLASEMKGMGPFRNIESPETSMGMGHFGKLTSVKDLPSEKIILQLIKEAMQLSDSGVTIKKKAPVKKGEIVTPDYFEKALSKNKKAKAVFDKFPPSHRKEYIMWITEAKTEETRQKRMATALEWIAEGKGRNWKYETSSRASSKEKR